MRDLNGQIESIKNAESMSHQEKVRLQEDLEQLAHERNDLVFRMNELTSKYEVYVATMGKEREEMTRANRNHIKLLTSKLLV